MLRIAAFVIALLLLAGSIDPTRGWLIALVVLTGMAALRLRPEPWIRIRPALDMRLAALIVSTMLLAGAVDATRDWLIVLSVVTGLAAFFPRIIAVPGSHDGDFRWP
jgi:outer membrane murein-binding lipoprotein Lpp